jgi:outer membrane protein OmpA-like peptidoglycan-associated protein
MKRLLFISFLLFSVPGYGQVYNLAENGDFEANLSYIVDSMGDLEKSWQFWTYLDEKGARYRITSNASTNVSDMLEHPENTHGKYIVYTSVGNDYYPDNMTLWHQDVQVKPNTTYLFSCRIANICCNKNHRGNLENISTQPSLVRLAVNGKKITKTISLDENSGWMLLEVEYLTKPEEKKINIEIQNLMNVYEGNDVAIDDIFFGLPENKGKKNPKSENTSEGDGGGNFQVGQYFDLNSVNFEVGKSVLPKSKPAVDNLAGFMKKYPTAEIRLEGHTEDLKGEKLNKELSINRVQAIKDYLVSQGIEAGRIVVLGLGQSMRFEKKETDPTNRILAIITKK